MRNSSINGGFSVAMFDYRRVFSRFQHPFSGNDDPHPGRETRTFLFVGRRHHGSESQIAISQIARCQIARQPQSTWFLSSGSAVQPLVDRQCSAVNLEHWDRARQGHGLGRGSTPDEGSTQNGHGFFWGIPVPQKCCGNRKLMEIRVKSRQQYSWRIGNHPRTSLYPETFTPEGFGSCLRPSLK